MTRNSIPILERMGVRAVTVGENGQVAPSAVLPIFSWRDEASGSSVIALFHALATVEHGQHPPPRRAETCARRGMMMVGIYVLDDGTVKTTKSERSLRERLPAKVAICYAWKLDNAGPHEGWRAELIYDAVEGLSRGKGNGGV